MSCFIPLKSMATTAHLPFLSTHYVLPRASRAVWRHAVATATGYDFSRALRGARKIVATSIETTYSGASRREWRQPASMPLTCTSLYVFLPFGSRSAAFSRSIFSLSTSTFPPTCQIFPRAIFFSPPTANLSPKTFKT